MNNEISLARILLATACPGSPALWAGSFTFYEIINNDMKKRPTSYVICQHVSTLNALHIHGDKSNAIYLSFPYFTKSSLNDKRIFTFHWLD